MADGKSEVAIRVKDKLQMQVEKGRLFCPLSWGVLEELFEQSEESRTQTANLMEELSLNTIYIMRAELFSWELTNAIHGNLEDTVPRRLNGLFVPPAAFVGSTLSISFDLPEGAGLSQEALKDAQSFMNRELSKIGVVELASQMRGRQHDKTPPAYSEVASRVANEMKGKKRELFLIEVAYCFQTYVLPELLSFPPDHINLWTRKFGPPEDVENWFIRALADLPAMHNYVEVMLAASTQPTRKDKYNHFLDNEIVVAPLAYADVFVSADRGIKDLVSNRTKILKRSKCQYFNNLEAFEDWLGRC